MAESSSPSRLPGLDVLRGAALCGIIQMNVQLFDFPAIAYIRPTLGGPLEGLDLAAWVFTHVVFELKFFSLFSLLFGAGVLLSNPPGKPLGRFWSRQAWLLAFGVAHGFLVWIGDILMTYALVAPLVVGARTRDVRKMLQFAAVLLSVPLVLVPAFELSMPFLPLEFRTLLDEGFAPSAAALAEEGALLKGPWWAQVTGRAFHTVESQVYALLTSGLWRGGGFMLLGMALAKHGVFDGKHPALERTLMRWGFGLGVPLAVVSSGVLVWLQFPVSAALSLGLLNYLAAIAVALGLVGLGLTWNRRSPEGRLTRHLAATGRWAFTHYLSQSLVMGFLFFGWGLGWYGTLARWQLVPVAALIYLAQLGASPWLEATFGRGPFERAWRALTRLTSPTPQAGGAPHTSG